MIDSVRVSVGEGLNEFDIVLEGGSDTLFVTDRDTVGETVIDGVCVSEVEGGVKRV